MPLLTTQSAKGYGFSQLVSSVATNSYESIATLTGSGNLASNAGNSFDFTSIPSTFKHLQLRLFVHDTSVSTGYGETDIRINNDSGGTSSYKKHYLRTTSNAANWSSGYFSNPDDLYGPSYPRGGSYSGTWGFQIIDILDYASSSKSKTIKAYGGFVEPGGTAELSLWGGLWLNQSAINRITIYPNQYGYATYSHAALYGLK